MWLGLALVVWLWGLALYLVVYYFAVMTWGGKLHYLLGQNFYNAHIPTGGWEAALVPTIVFLLTLGIVGAARRPIGAAAGWLTRRTPVPRRAGLVVCNVTLIAMTVPTVHAGVAGAREGITAAIQRARMAEIEKSWAEETARDPFYNGEGMVGPVTTFVMAGGRLLLSSDGCYRFSNSSWCGNGPSGRFEWRYDRRGGVIELLPPPGADQPLWRLHEVHWGERVYLVDDASLRSFANEVNMGREPRSLEIGDFLLRLGDESRSVAGLPALPAPGQDFLLETPLEGRVVAVEQDGTTWVGLGSEHGLREGMVLWTLAPIPKTLQHLWGGRTATSEPLELLKLEARRCRVRPATHFGFILPVGLAVTSREPPEPSRD